MGTLDYEKLVTEWEDKRELKNLMGRFAHAYLFKDEETIFDEYWSKSEDVCYGTNNGWYAGSVAVKEYFESLAAAYRISDEIIKKAFPEETKDIKPGKKGLGTCDVVALSAELIEIAGDRKTAKGLWWNAGQDARGTEIGPLHSYTFGVFAVDFVLEDGAWKIWHMDYQEDINSPMGNKWWEAPKVREPIPEFAVLKGVVTQPNVPEERRPPYSITRAFKPFQPMPEPYDTFSNTFSYGM